MYGRLLWDTQIPKVHQKEEQAHLSPQVPSGMERISQRVRHNLVTAQE